ncbi:hypothetical protein SEA_ZOOMAN_320 [Microbacterium phage Zooman]|nr:hypothetical protein SEA_ZOOMAN_7 [Microbacterium phage Zooman]UDL16561.1 hypothetical protein SEA_ZOOMAN_320 [Microbacterium phage Zooman]
MTDFQKGQNVEFAQSSTGTRAAGWGAGRVFQRGHVVTITAVRKNTITVKNEADGYSYNVPRSSLAAPNGEEWNEAEKPKPRKIGEVPEGGISPDDPRLAWLWEDAAKFADRNGYCSYYDRIADGLNIPGRPRDITVSIKVNGLDIAATVRARSRREAEDQVKSKLATAS